MDLQEFKLEISAIQAPAQGYPNLRSKTLCRRFCLGTTSFSFTALDMPALLKNSFSFTARPEILIQVSAETINDVHYQSVQCSAVAGRPQAQISWLVKGVPASGYPFTVKVSDVESHSNRTSTVSSILRFPTHLQDEDSVTCVVQHPTLPRPKLTTVMVETFSKCSNEVVIA